MSTAAQQIDKFPSRFKGLVEIVLDVVRNISRLDLIIIVAGDSDYLELKKSPGFDPGVIKTVPMYQKC